MEKLELQQNAAAIQKEHVEQKELTQKEALDILYFSFYYSQGDEDLQTYLFRYIAEKHPELRAPETSLDVDQTRQFFRFVNSPAHEHGTRRTNDSNVGLEIEKKYREMKDILDGQDSGTPAFSIEKIKAEILLRQVDQDNHFTLLTSRPRDKEISKGYARSGISHLYAYVLKDEVPPGPSVFAEMFKDLKNSINDSYVRGHLGLERLQIIDRIRRKQEEV
jgi:hypothetical protein